MKKVHFVSLLDCYNKLPDWSGNRIFLALHELIPQTSRFYVGPLFSSMMEAIEFSAEGFSLFSEKELVDAADSSAPLYDPSLGSDKLLKTLVSDQLREEDVASYYWWNQVESQIGNYEEFLRGAKKTIEALFEKIAEAEECLVFIVFPFGEIICKEFLPDGGKTPIFKFLKGFSLLNDGSRIWAETL